MFFDMMMLMYIFFFFQAEDGIRDSSVTGVQTCALPIFPEGFGDGVNAAFALNGFEDDGADGVIEFGLEVGEVVEADEFDAGNKRSEGQTIFFGRRDA